MWSSHPFGKELLCLMGVVAGERQTPLKFYFGAHDDFRTDLNSPRRIVGRSLDRRLMVAVVRLG